jgi:hypothetical protein
MPFIYDPTAGGSTPTVEEWVRPTDWLALPTLGAAEQKFVGLYAVYESGSNFISLSAAGNYTVDWGDGVAENYSTGVQSYHTYDYSAISSGTLSSRGYRQVIVTVTPQAGQNLTNINLQRRHNQAGLSASSSAPWLDISLNGSNITSLSIGGNGTIELKLLERATIGTTGAITNFSNLFTNCYSLQSVSLLSTASGTNFSSMFYNCHSLQSVPLFNTVSGTNFSNMFFYCYSLQSVPLLNTASGTNFSNMFNGCASLQSVPLFNTVSGTSFNGMFNTCFSLQVVPLLDTSNGTTFAAMLQNCQSLQTIPLFNAANGTSFASMFLSCFSLSQGALSGTRYAISYSNCKLSREEIVEIFNNLGTAVGTQTITVSNNWGTPLLTAGDLAIATGKGWTVAT